MKIGIACGGTGGHVLPGIATGKRLRDRGHDVTLWLSGRITESWVMQEWGGRAVFVASSGLPTRLSAGSFRSAAAMLRAIAVCLRRLRCDRPDVLLAMGGYASIGPAVAARLRGVPLVLHEANAVAGRAASFLSRMARVTALGFADAAPSVAGRTVVTGFPLRDIAPGTIDGWRRGDERLTLLVMGGSQGAHALNMICGEAVSGMDVPRLRLVHLTGKADEAAMSELYRRSGIDARVFAFLSDMGKAYGSADFAVCRAGAASCAELEFMRVPALLVPLPGAPRDHQTRNASSACSDGGMMMRRQADLTVEWLRGFISGMCRDRSVLIEMKRRLEARPARDSTGVLAELVESVGSRRSKGGSQDAHL